MNQFVFLVIGLLALSVIPADAAIPNWVKAIANWWSNGNITDAEFIDAMEFLIENEVIIIPELIDLRQQVHDLEIQLGYEKNSTTIQANNTAQPIPVFDPTSSKWSENIEYIMILAKNYTTNEISLSQFINEHQKLIDDGKIPEIDSPVMEGASGNEPVPNWVKDVIRWYPSGLTNNQDYYEVLKWFHENGYLKNKN